MRNKDGASKSNNIAIVGKGRLVMDVEGDLTLIQVGVEKVDVNMVNQMLGVYVKGIRISNIRVENV